MLLRRQSPKHQHLNRARNPEESIDLRLLFETNWSAQNIPLCRFKRFKRKYSFSKMFTNHFFSNCSLDRWERNSAWSAEKNLSMSEKIWKSSFIYPSISTKSVDFWTFLKKKSRKMFLYTFYGKIEQNRCFETLKRHFIAQTIPLDT